MDRKEKNSGEADTDVKTGQTEANESAVPMAKQPVEKTSKKTFPWVGMRSTRELVEKRKLESMKSQAGKSPTNKRKGKSTLKKLALNKAPQCSLCSASVYQMERVDWDGIPNRFAPLSIRPTCFFDIFIK